MNTNMDKLLEDGYVERVYMKTPNGGDYSEAHFFDDNMNYTTKNKAMHVIIKECNADGEIIKEIFMNRNVDPGLPKVK